MNFLRSFSRFWYDFIIGDDWKIAVAVVAALAVVAGAMKAALFGDRGLAALGATAIIVFFAISLAIDVRPTRSKH